MNPLYLRWFARIVAIIWGGFWTWFGLASGIGEGGTLFEVIRHASVPGLILLCCSFVAWKWERPGAWVLIGLGVIITIAYPIVMSHMILSTKIFVWLTMGLPPLISGIILLITSKSALKPAS